MALAEVERVPKGTEVANVVTVLVIAVLHEVVETNPVMAKVKLSLTVAVTETPEIIAKAATPESSAEVAQSVLSYVFTQA
jgi:hypothetical protein